VGTAAGGTVRRRDRAPAVLGKGRGDGSWWAWVSWVHESGGRVHHNVVQVRADSLRPLEPPGAYKDVPRRVRGLDGQIRDAG
jgi:hypothetical protein